MLCLITYRRLAQGILLLHRYLLLYHPSVLPSLHEFIFNVQNRKYNHSLLHCIVHKISFPTSLSLPISDFGQESYVRFTSVVKYVLKFQNAQRSMFQTRWFSMRWNGNFMELVNISFSSFVHFWTSSKIEEDNIIHRGIRRGWWFILQLFRHDFSLNYSNLVYMVSENRSFSWYVLFLRSLAWPSTKHDRDLQNLL
jgi:hypothetical protein